MGIQSAELRGKVKGKSIMKAGKLFLILAVAAQHSVQGADVTGSVTVSRFRVNYREYHMTNAKRAVKFDCSSVKDGWKGKSSFKVWKRATCYDNPNPHKLCDYTKRNAANFYRSLAIIYARRACKTRSIKYGGCTWTKRPIWNCKGISTILVPLRPCPT